MSGIRAKLQGPGTAFRDFVIAEESARGLPGFVNLIGIDSPGLTSSLAIADEVARLVYRVIPRSGRARAAAAAVALASLAPPAVVLHDIAHNGRNVPYVDQWRDVELSVKAVTGTVTLADVFRQVSARLAPCRTT